MWTVTFKSRWDRKIDTVPDEGRRNWTRFLIGVRVGQMHPRDAAGAVGDMNFKSLRGTANQFEVKLTGKHRATFQIFEGAPNTMHVLQVGGHT